MSGILSSAGFFLFLRDTSNKKMFKPLIAAVAAAPLFAGAAFAGPYVNVEANASYPDGEYSSATTDLHFGFDGGSDNGKLGYYVQGGPAFVHSDSTDDTETELSGKVGVSYAVADSTSVYGEIAGITNEDSSGDDIIDFSGKLGLTYKF
tara:strand:+ start:589 stop:1035 length:447 start_codon:yes stop_codon:yes gene_type:complete